MKKNLTLILGCLLVACEANPIDPISLLVGSGYIAAKAAAYLGMIAVGGGYLVAKTRTGSFALGLVAGRASKIPVIEAAIKGDRGLVAQETKTFLSVSGQQAQQALIRLRERVRSLVGISSATRNISFDGTSVYEKGPATTFQAFQNRVAAFRIKATSEGVAEKEGPANYYSQQNRLNAVHVDNKGSVGSPVHVYFNDSSSRKNYWKGFRNGALVTGLCALLLSEKEEKTVAIKD